MDVLTGIESVIEDEKKSSTYKFALVTAIMDYIIENPTEPASNGMHFIPIMYLAKRWLYYYHPLMVIGERGIRQGNTQIALHGLVKKYLKSEKSFGFVLDKPESIIKLADHIESENLLSSALIKLLSEIRRVIIDMPLRYIKVSNNEINEELVGRAKVKQDTYNLFGLINTTLGVVNFQDYHEVRRKSTSWKLIDSCSWSELLSGEVCFVSMGHYTYKELVKSRFFVRDTVLKRWLDLTVIKYLKENPEQIYDLYNGLLVLNQRAERNSSIMKQFRQMALDAFQNMRCLYCDRKLKGDFDLDHFIPWSKYPVNYFWNLFPSCQRCNRSKSDKIIELNKDIVGRLHEFIKVWLKYFEMKEINPIRFGGSFVNYNTDIPFDLNEIIFQNIQEITSTII